MKEKLSRRERGAFVVQRAGLLEEIIVAANVTRNFPGVDVQNFGCELSSRNCHTVVA